MASSIYRSATIYLITNHAKSERNQYVGKTINPLMDRWKNHWDQARLGCEYHLHAAMRKYNRSNWTLTTLEIVEPAETLEESIDLVNRLEQHYIEEYDTFTNGYNMTKGGEGIWGYQHSEETIEKIRKRNLEIANRGADHPRFGIPRTEEEKAKMRLGIKQSGYYDNGKPAKHIAKWKAARDKADNWAHTEEAKAKISDTMTGYQQPRGSCLVCRTEAGVSLLKRFHMENCGVKVCYSKQEVITCPHCGKSGGKANLKSFHFDNCLENQALTEEERSALREKRRQRRKSK